jgi:hypothetical protein
MFLIELAMVNLPEWTNLHACFHDGYPGKVGSMNTPKQLSREAIEEFKAIYHDKFGKTLTDDEVQEIALRLLRFFGILQQHSADKADLH